LSPEALSVVRATAPVVAEHADQITAHFYPRMFAAHPELLRVFNQGNKATGEQSKALARSVVAYAVQLIDPKAPSFDHVMRRIAFRHHDMTAKGRSDGRPSASSVSAAMTPADAPIATTPSSTKPGRYRPNDKLLAFLESL
jgi:hypothetical protein